MKRRHFLSGGAAVAAMAAGGVAWARPRMRVHKATKAAALKLQKASSSGGRNKVAVSVANGVRKVVSNGIPDHAVGAFPNSGNPNAIRAQSYRFEMPASPSSRAGGNRRQGLIGVAVNGVPFDPGAAEFWQGKRWSGWQYEALGGAVTLGLDANHGHVQPTGAYHYHGLPIGLMQALGWSATAESPLIGWAADGYPIYAMTARVGGQVREMRSSYQLKSGQRPGGRAPDGAHDGAFVQDYTYRTGSGDLDEHNGTTVVTQDYPEGTYAYFLTREFPVIPRSLRGLANASFSKRRG